MKHLFTTEADIIFVEQGAKHFDADQSTARLVEFEQLSSQLAPPLHQLGREKVAIAIAILSYLSL